MAVSHRRRAGSTVNPFYLGLTVPDATNTGVTGAARTTYSGPTSITGSTDMYNPTLIENVDVTDILTINSGYVRFYNVYFSGGAGASTNTALVDCRAANVGRVWFDRCEFDPGEANASVWLNGTIGHHMTVHRCRMRRVVDGVGSYNTHAAATDNVVTGNYFEWTVRFDTDPNHADGTHNDWIQHQGGIGLQVIGNAFHGYNYYADGTTPTDPVYTRTAQGVLVQENVAIAGTYYCGDIEIRNNWIWGHMHPLVLKTRSASYSIYDAAVLDNLWYNADQRDYGGTYKFYNIRLDLGVTLLDAVGGSAVGYPVGATLNTENNVYDAAVPTYGGNAVYVRRDNLYGG